MRYNEYLVKPEGCGPEKRFGILGEHHLYNAKESRLARKIIRKYDVIAMEGSGNFSQIEAILVLYVPFFLVYAIATERLEDTSLELARKAKKEIVRLEEDIDNSFSFRQKMALAAAGLITIPLAPLCYLYWREYGDSLEEGTEAYKAGSASKNKNANKRRWLLRLLDFAYYDNLEERDKIMAARAAEILKTRPESLLIVCGEKHFDGVIQNLYKEVRLGEPIATKELQFTGLTQRYS